MRLKSKYARVPRRILVDHTVSCKTVLHPDCQLELQTMEAVSKRIAVAIMVALASLSILVIITPKKCLSA